MEKELEKEEKIEADREIIESVGTADSEMEWGTPEKARAEREKLEEREQEAQAAIEENKKVSIVFRIVDTFGELFWLNVLFVIFCLPIITIGAAVAALYSTTLKMARHEEGIATRDFIAAFKSNFKQATLAWLIILVIAAAMVYQYMLIISGGTSTGNVLTMVLGFEMVVLSLILPLFFPLMARFQNSIGRLFLNSFVLSITHIKLWIVAFVPWMVPVILAYFQPVLFAYTWYFWILVLTALTAYGISIVITKTFKELELKELEKIENKEEEKKAKEEKTEKKSSGIREKANSMSNQDGHTYVYKKNGK